MHEEHVILTIFDGNSATDHVLDQKQTCVIGRAYDCDIQLPPDDWHLDVSRYHCQLEIDPPRMKLRDLGSTNGTYVNGQLIGCGPMPRNVAATLPARELHHGDEIRIGQTLIRVQVVAHELVDADYPALFIP